MPDDREAMLWKTEDDHLRCVLCAHRCRIPEGEVGFCRVRRNEQGTLRPITYGRLVAANVDPIEKKPLFHFLPGSRSLSIASAGCNFQCEFCQNWQISQAPRDGREGIGREATPEQIVAAAGENGCASISYTYTEPTVFFEFAYDCATLAKERGIGNCFVSNGYMTPEAVAEVAPVLDAINVDLKAFRDETYKQVMKARLQPVLTCLESLVKAGVWVEVTTLIVPGMNDSREELSDIAGFIAEKLGRHVPWHVSRFHADYKMDHTPTTPMETLETACEVAGEKGLRHVYCGNVAGHSGESTYCPRCGEMLIRRMGYQIRDNRLAEGATCPACGEPIRGVWQLPAPQPGR